jgi:hypothetical protein
MYRSFDVHFTKTCFPIVIIYHAIPFAIVFHKILRAATAVPCPPSLRMRVFPQEMQSIRRKIPFFHQIPFISRTHGIRIILIFVKSNDPKHLDFVRHGREIYSFCRSRLDSSVGKVYIYFSRIDIFCPTLCTFISRPSSYKNRGRQESKIKSKGQMDRSIRFIIIFL